MYKSSCQTSCCSFWGTDPLHFQLPRSSAQRTFVSWVWCLQGQRRIQQWIPWRMSTRFQNVSWTSPTSKSHKIFFVSWFCLKWCLTFVFFLRGLLGMLFFQSDSQATSQGLMRMGHPLYCKETPMWRIRFSFTTTVWKKLWPKITGLLLKGWRRDESLELQPWQMVIWYRCWLLISLRNTGIAWGSLPLLEPHNVESQLPKS